MSVLLQIDEVLELLELNSKLRIQLKKFLPIDSKPNKYPHQPLKGSNIALARLGHLRQVRVHRIIHHELPYLFLDYKCREHLKVLRSLYDLKRHATPKEALHFIWSEGEKGPYNITFESVLLGIDNPNNTIMALELTQRYK